MNKNNYNLLKRIFPNDNCNNLNELKYDSEGLWSITHPIDAENISKNIKLFEKIDVKINTILDMTAGIGGNTISFCKNFKNVISVEIDSNRFHILKNNVNNYSYKNITLFNGDSVKLLPDYNQQIDAVFIDPPWGGPKYKNDKNINLTLSNYKLKTIIELISKYNYNQEKIKIISLKLPYNYDFKNLINLTKDLTQTNKIEIIGNAIYLYLVLN